MNNQWQKRQTIKLDCPSGNEVMVRRPGPDLGIKAGKFVRVLQKIEAKDRKRATLEEQLLIIEQLPDQELEQLMAFARVVLVDVVVNPPLSLNPKEGQLGPDDVPLIDFWFILTCAMNGFRTMPVQMKEGETTVDAVETFPSGPESSTASGVDSESIQ